MSNEIDITRDQAISANIEVHSALAKSGEYNRSPHFRPENKAKVRSIIEELLNESGTAGSAKLLDIGCGTGFIIDLVRDLVREVHGVDVTDEMISKVDTSNGNIFLKNAVAESTGFESETFDMVTAYSFLDHILDYRAVLEEAYRVMKPGAVFYCDLNPNRAFSEMLEGIEQSYAEKDLPFSVSREIRSMLHNGELYEDNYGISSEALTNAEPGKTYLKGFDSVEVLNMAEDIGFSKVSCDYDWFLGEGVLKNSDSPLNLQDVNAFLRQMLPATRALFKYIRFVFYK